MSSRFLIRTMSWSIRYRHMLERWSRHSTELKEPYMSRRQEVSRRCNRAELRRTFPCSTPTPYAVHFSTLASITGNPDRVSTSRWYLYNDSIIRVTPTPRLFRLGRPLSPSAILSKSRIPFQLLCRSGHTVIYYQRSPREVRYCGRRSSEVGEMV